MEYDSEEERNLFSKYSHDEEDEIESENSSTSEEEENSTPDDLVPSSIVDSKGVDNNGSDSNYTSTDSSNDSSLSEKEEELFNEDDNNIFTSEIIDHASSFISVNRSRSPSLSFSSSSSRSSSPLTINDDNNIELPSELFERISPETTPTLTTPKAPLNVSPTSTSLLNELKSTEVSVEREQLQEEKSEEIIITKPTPYSKSKRRCEECSNCLNVTNCRQCRYCRDMKKYGGPGRLRQKCITRQCLKLSRVLAQQGGGASDETKMGVVISSREILMQEAGITKATPTLGTSSQQPFYSTETTPTIKAPPTNKPTKKSTQPSNKKKPKNKPNTNRKKVTTKRQRNKESSEEEEVTFRATRRRPLSDLYDSWASSKRPTEVKRQCLGPECVYAARKHSKYCSEECGVELAMRRIKTYLPSSKELWKSEEEPVASKLNKDKLKQLERDQTRMKERLVQLESYSKRITDHVTKMKEMTAQKGEEESEGASYDNEDLTIYCATCGQPTPLRRALIHMERCFAKLEGTVSFGSIVKNEGIDIFCDKYDRSQGTYCKRLKVLCPEHTKEPKVGPSEICGCPLESDFPSKRNTCTLFCRNLKKNCPGHYCWEKLRRGEIDQEKLNLYLKLEELSEQMRLFQWQLSYRSSLLAIMLHHTVNHTEAK